MKTINDLSFKKQKRPIKVLQFGEGNFLRAFVDYMIDIANEKNIFDGNIAIVKPISYGSLKKFRDQNCNYTVILRGKQNGKTVNESRVITSVESVYDAESDYADWMSLASLNTLRFVVSNTTEAGITLDKNDHFDGLPETYPGKLTKFLFERYNSFNGDRKYGLIILPVELIENNGGKLYECVTELSKVWNLPEDFRSWIDEACIFCSTLVDRIVTGFPRENVEKIYVELGYKDSLVDIAEPFALWVIESNRDISRKFPLDKAGLPVIFTDNQKPYRERKVRILNGAHTSSVLAAYLCGINIVRDCMHDRLFGKFIKCTVNDEIAPFVPLSKEETLEFASSVFERFENPFIDHELLSISLNSVSKWKARVLPSFRDYYNKNGKLPKLLTFSFAALLAFYRSDDLQADGLHSHRKNGDEYVIHDGNDVLKYFAANAKKDDGEYTVSVASNTEFWGEDLTEYKGFADEVEKHLALLCGNPTDAVEQVLEDK